MPARLLSFTSRVTDGKQACLKKVLVMISDEMLAQCQEMLGYKFKKIELLTQALTHTSAANTRRESNERMEFLGDAVLGFTICNILFRKYTDLDEGDMTKIKSAVVSRNTCNEIIRETELGMFVIMDRPVRSLRDVPDSIAACLIEAIIGAIYLDGGMRNAEKFIRTQFQPHIDQAMASSHQKNYKSLLQQHVQRLGNNPPEYVILDEQGPEHCKCFEIGIMIDGKHLACAWGRSKKLAEQAAAMRALVDMGIIDEDED
jgi:ribonuclease-3